ncbi:MAG TPA: hypothetical protein VLB50_11060 [Ignavibacteriaceae bacterium]|nr:hypothetical protein [Ignavibacteriaceae bacterium]
MRKLKIFLSVVIPEIGGIIFNIIPMALFLSMTNFFSKDSYYSPTFIAAVLLISLALMLIPFRLIQLFAQSFKINLDECGAFSIAIIGGLTAGGLFYLLVQSHFSMTWAKLPDYALLGVIQSIIAQIIFRYIPEEWKLRLEE